MVEDQCKRAEVEVGVLVSPVPVERKVPAVEVTLTCALHHAKESPRRKY